MTDKRVITSAGSMWFFYLIYAVMQWSCDRAHGYGKWEIAGAGYWPASFRCWIMIMGAKKARKAGSALFARPLSLAWQYPVAIRNTAAVCQKCVLFGACNIWYCLVWRRFPVCLCLPIRRFFRVLGGLRRASYDFEELENLNNNIIKVRYSRCFSGYIVLFFGPSDWIWTSGLLNPIQARYQLRHTRISVFILT